MAEKKKGFSIGDYNTPDFVSNLDTAAAAVQVIEIPIQSVQINEKNFYDTSNVEELVKSIALNGLIEPIIVMPTDPIPGAVGPAYRIISGHRRFSAWWELSSDDPVKYAAIQAIVKTPANEIMEELLLIEANRATRVMSSADTMKQAERYTDLLGRLKEQGVEIPGRLRDAVAEAMNISASRLARLNVIRKGLSDKAMAMFETNALNESVAYELAQAPIEVQEKIFASSKEPAKMTAWQIEERVKWRANLDKIKCKGEQVCNNRDRMFSEKCKDANRYNYLQCVQGECCKNCSRLYTCASACSQFSDKIKKQKALERDLKSKEKSDAETKKLNLIAENNKQWLRLGYAREKSGVEYEEISQALRDVQCYVWPCKASMDQYENGECDDSWSANILGRLNADALAIVARLFRCSTDYLLGLSTELTVYKGEWQKADEIHPNNGDYVLILKNKSDVIEQTVYFKDDFMDATDKSTANNYVKDVEYWSYPPRLPDGKKFPGQSTIEKLARGEKP
ncbi:MAG: hypothetical protein CVU91_13455 [Firmicutes bacterium HGW-Firmicutes-16]|nr:MAG: hypothetical protein CVU91_13455 [Firmicutes bacterium HGW-Firmicutes-16]